MLTAAGAAWKNVAAPQLIQHANSQHKGLRTLILTRANSACRANLLRGPALIYTAWDSALMASKMSSTRLSCEDLRVYSKIKQVGKLKSILACGRESLLVLPSLFTVSLLLTHVYGMK